jgi:hypothetical protein
MDEFFLFVFGLWMMGYGKGLIPDFGIGCATSDVVIVGHDSDGC